MSESIKRTRKLYGHLHKILLKKVGDVIEFISFEKLSFDSGSLFLDDGSRKIFVEFENFTKLEE